MENLGLKGCWKITKGERLKFRIRNVKYSLDYAWQRAYRGYDSRELWGFNSMFCWRTIEILKRYKETRMGLWWCPDGYEIGNYDEHFKRYALTENQMDAIIDTIIFHLQMADEDFVEEQLYGTNVFDNDYVCQYDKDKSLRIAAVRQQNQDMALDLIKLFFNDLWD